MPTDNEEPIVGHLDYDEAERQVLIQALDILLGVFDDWHEPLDEQQKEQQFRAQMLLDTIRLPGDALDHEPIKLRLSNQDGSHA